jgi:UDP-GlcNAc:undecaprenyl-phosphate GlcNAc-1-phosphate transferase
MHPSLEYGLVCVVAAAVTYLLTPAARTVAIRWGAVAMPRDRDVHAVAMPRMGGVALFLGFAAAIVVAHELPTLRASFSSGPNLTWILLAAMMLCAIGVIDDRLELDSLTKLAGQVAAAGVMVIKGGVQLAVVYTPWSHGVATSLGADLGIPATILLTVITINAINFIDGLDGLAAGVTAISALAFFIFAYHLASIGDVQVAAAPTLISAALAGCCLGFLPHNFSPARIFMGDSGSMLVGLMLSAAATTATSSVDPSTLGGRESVALFLPLLLPIAVLALPFVDLLLAVVRRVRRGQSPFAPDKEHLHHRLLEIGHTHRRAVLVLYFWSALLAGGGVTFAIFHRPWLVLVTSVVLAAVGALASAVPWLRVGRR